MVARSPGVPPPPSPPAQPNPHRTADQLITERAYPSGARIATVRLKPGERVQIVSDDSFYRLGGQVDDIVQGHVIAEMRPVRWCSISQEWINA